MASSRMSSLPEIALLYACRRLRSTFLLDSEAHAKIVVTLVKHTTKNLVANNDNYALAA